MNPPVDHTTAANAHEDASAQRFFEALTAVMRAVLSVAEDKIGFQAGEGLKLKWMREALIQMDLAPMANRLPAPSPDDSTITTTFAKTPAVD